MFVETYQINDHKLLQLALDNSNQKFEFKLIQYWVDSIDDFKRGIYDENNGGLSIIMHKSELSVLIDFLDKCKDLEKCEELNIESIMGEVREWLNNQ